MRTAELLSPPINYAVVQLPERRYPGVVVQGDSLNAMVVNLRDVLDRASRLQDEELSDGIEEIYRILFDARDHYESVCRDKGIELPYPESNR